MIEIRSITISPNPVNANTAFLIAIDVVDSIEAYRWSDLKQMTWADIKLLTWNEISPYNNPDNRSRDIYSGSVISGDDFNL